MILPSLAAAPGLAAAYLSAHFTSVPRDMLALGVAAAGLVAGSMAAKILATAFRLILVGGGILVAWQIFVR